MGKWRSMDRTRGLTCFLAFMMIAVFFPAGGVHGESTLLKTGNYYFSHAPDGGNSPDKGAIGLVSSVGGVLLDGSTTTYAGWMGTGTGTPETVQVAFDLLRDYPLDRINVVLNSPNSFWGFKDLTVKYRAEAATDYVIAAQHTRTPVITSTSPSTDWNYSVNIPMSNKTARFIVIEIKRPHAFQHIPLTEVQIFKGTGQEGVNPGPALTAEEMALELKKDSLSAENLLKKGNYFFSYAPDGGNSPDKGATGLVSSTNGALLDGSTATYAGWLGSSSAPGTVKVVFDLLKDYPLDRINLVLNSPNAFWGFKEFTVKYRPEALTDYYYLAAKHIRTPGIVSTSPSTTWPYSVNIPMSNKTARFIIIEIKRPHCCQHIPLTEVQIFKGTGQEGVNPGPALTAAEMALELKKDALLVDKYGQFYYETWPGKVTSDEQLQQEYAMESNALEDVSLDLTQYDPYGGIKSGGQYTGTGYFRLQQIDNKWWFITPDGYKFILKGVDATSIWEWGYGTPLKKDDGTLKKVFEELPDPVAYSPAYVNDSNGERVSFVIANVMRKYGGDFERKWEAITKKRLIDWGFNAFSKWTKPTNVTFPYIQVLQDPMNLKRIQWTYDVFDPRNESIIEAALGSQLESAKNSKWLIGYTYDNEAGWTTDIVKEVLTYNSTSPAKNAFVDFLAPRYNNDIAAVNQLLGTNAASFAALKDISINIAKVPAADISEYIKLASRTYFSTVKSIIRKYDTNHLFLGVSVVPTWRTDLNWDSAAMEFVDAFSVDNYTSDASWISRYEGFGKPLLNLEYTFSTTEHGLSPVNAATTVPTTADRGYAFQSFVESQASHPLFVGSGWFSYYDQAVPGRKDGENYNIGLVNQQDQPYTDMVNIMKTVNAGLENVHAASDNSRGPETSALLTPAQPDGQNGWYVNPVTLSLHASNNPSSILKPVYSLDGGVAWKPYTSPLTFNQDGRYTVHYHSTDEVGNEEAIKTIGFMVDTTAPTTVAALSPAAPDGNNGWYTSDVTVSLAVYDPISGVAKTEYRVNNGGWIAYTGSIPAFGEGNYRIDYRSMDQAGNMEQIRTVEFKIDKTAPLLTVELDRTSIWPLDHQMVDIQATLHPIDAGAGVESVVLSSVTSNEPNSGQGDIEANIGTSDTLIRLRAERSGTGSGRIYTITYTVTDKAGHKKDASAIVTVPHDRGAEKQ
ncbi:OmpL47-type beta-barrel domain-containing protein [Paenibacillus sp. HJGM_3]|uniref:OmpL47-type beta-barrel domain-containing protein n=1 Tax=Paenibacillus sp. HJGM_3 TaxID=3379816 RepID=UPI0038583FB3